MSSDYSTSAPPRSTTSRVGIDIGGTFTDAVILAENGELHIAKVLTRIDDRAAGFLNALDQVCERGNSRPQELEFLSHGTTTATNALVENTLASVGFVTNLGFTDMLEIGTQQRHSTYGLRTPNPPAIVPRDRCFGVTGRLDAQGRELQPVDPDQVRSVAAELRDAGVEAIAVCLLFSFKDPKHEQHVAEILREELPDTPISISSDLAPEIREYVRASTTVLNAALLPLVGKYIADIEAGLKKADVTTPLYLMQSNGGLTAASVAADRPLTLAESGPAAGVMGLSRIGEVCGEPNLLTFDMGGTTIDVSLVVDGVPAVRFGGEIDGRPVNLPQIDVISIGAGGGSIAAVDEVGALSVGPASAGSRPGPAAYGFGGTAATVTDAHVVLGTLSSHIKLGGRLQLDYQAAYDAVRREVAEPLGLSVEDAASGILRVVNANMSRAARLVSVTRGLDPRGSALASFGGAGSLHACAVADELQMTKILIPRYPGVACAVGLLASDIRHDTSHGWPRRMDDLSANELDLELGALESRVRDLVARAGHADAEVTYEVDMRFEGQGYNLTIPLDRSDLSPEGLARLNAALATTHAAAYGYVPDHPETEIVNLRATAKSQSSSEGVVSASVVKTSTPPAGPTTTKLYSDGSWRDVSVYRREHIDHAVVGPALIAQEDTTILVGEGWTAVPVVGGNLLLERNANGGNK